MRTFTTATESSPWTDVRFKNLERLAPASVAGGALAAWLRAPIGGVSLVRRLFEPLVGRQIRRCVAEQGTIASMICHFTAYDPVFGLKLMLRPHDKNTRNVVDFECGGLVDGAHSAGKEVRVLKTNTPESLILTARMALEGDLTDRPVAGQWHRQILMGPRAVAHSSLQSVGISAIGERSHVDEGVFFGPGSIIGANCRIGRDVRISNSVVLDGATIPAGTKLDSIVWFP